MNGRSIIGRVLAFVASALLVLPGSGCAADQSAPPELLDLVAELENQPGELSQATSILTVQCLRKHGFDVPPQPTHQQPHNDVYLGLVGVFRSEKEAASLGYTSTVNAPESLDDYENSLPEARREQFRVALQGPEDAPMVNGTTKFGAVIGRSSVGCLAEADKHVFGSLDAEMLGSVLRDEAMAATQGEATDLAPSDGRAYEECMAAAGYQVDGFNAFTVAGEKFGVYRQVGQPPKEEERAMAVADYQCQQEIHLIERLREHYARRAGDWVVANERRLLEWRGTVEQSLVRAKAVIDG
ncbi:MAG: hypothetical protein E7L00_03105 [Propionibacteriaceae bacterium]|nr:hypothetical protein [Propionibacteriaceae bacterium]